MKYERITTTRLLSRIEDLSFTLGRLYAGEGHLVSAARNEFDGVKWMLRQELLARIARRRRRGR